MKENQAGIQRGMWTESARPPNSDTPSKYGDIRVARKHCQLGNQTHFRLELWLCLEQISLSNVIEQTPFVLC